jgi:hypothetical protein
MKRLLTAILATAGLTLGSFMLPASPALAATCSGNGCNGQDPAATGCASDGYTVASAPVTDPYGRVGTVELRYSPKCGTNWSRVTMSVATENVATIMAIIERSDGLHYDYGWSGRAPAGLQIYGDMVYAPTTSARASGQAAWIDAATGVKRLPNGQTGWY